MKAVLLAYVYAAAVGFTPISYEDSMSKYVGEGNYEKAKYFLNQSRSSEILENDSALVEWLIKHSRITAILGENDSALISINRANELSKAINSKYLKVKAKVQELEFNRKLSRYHLGQQVIYSLLNEEIKDSNLLCSFYHRAAAVYNEMHYANRNPTFLDTARLYSETSLAIAKRLNNMAAQATCYNELGDIYKKMGEKELSYRNYHDAIKLLDGKDLYNQMNTMKNLAEFLANNQSYDSALYYYNYALKKLRETNHFNLLMGVYGGLKNTYFKMGDSLNGHKNHAQELYNMALLGEQIMKSRVNELYVELEAEKKEQEIIQKQLKLNQNERQFKYFSIFGIFILVAMIFLAYNSYQSKKKNKLLKRLNEDNQFLIGETNHRVKNNLQLIISLIGREMYKNKGEVPYLESISDKINAIASLHQQLYLNESIRSISVKDYVCDIYENLKESILQANFNLEMDIEDTEIPSEKATYLGLLVTELITNTAKHAYVANEEKLIGIKIFNNGKTLTLHYFDNGKGLPNGVRLKLVDILVKQLEGEIIPDPHEGMSGYSVQLKFKI